MSQPHGTAVDVAAVVASFGPADYNYMANYEYHFMLLIIQSFWCYI
jgi:hypothetical protein